MLEKIKNITEKIPYIIVNLIFFVLVIMIGFGIVVGIFAIIYYLGLWAFIVSILLIDFVLIVIDWWYDNAMLEKILWTIASLMLCMVPWLFIGVIILIVVENITSM